MTSVQADFIPAITGREVMVAKTKNAKKFFGFIFFVSLAYIGFQFTLRHHYYSGGPLHEYAKFEAEKTRYEYEDRGYGRERIITGTYVAGPNIFVQNAWYGVGVAIASFIALQVLSSGTSEKFNEVFADVDADRDPGDHDW